MDSSKTVKRMTLTEQVELYDAQAEAVFDAMLREMQNRRAEIISLGRFRLQTVGRVEYGDASWRASGPEQDAMWLEEGADLVAYYIMREHSPLQKRR